MSLRALRILTEIAARGSFAAAAEHLGLTQSAVSLQVKGLEEELGALLFERGGRRPKMNANGRLVLARAQEILATYDGLRYELNPQEQVRGILSLGVVPTAITGPLPAVLGRLHKQHEALQIKLQCSLSAELAQLVEGGELDAALITEPPFVVPAGCEWRPYDDEPFFVVAPRGVEAADEMALFDQFPFLRFDRAAWAGALIDGRLLALGIKPKEVMEFDSLEAALGLVAEGLGIVVVPLNKCRVVEAATRFTLVPFGDPQLSRRIGIYEKRRHARRILTDLVRSELCRECGFLP